MKKQPKSKLLQQVEQNMVFVEGGSFQMGSEEHKREKPIHTVQVPDFYLARYPVTVEEYLAFTEATQTNFPEWLEEDSKYNIYTGSDAYYKGIGVALQAIHHPIVGVSWDNAIAYCQWLNEETGKNYRLPSEAEWEYAARGGKHQSPFRYAGSNKAKEVAWYSLNSHGETKAVGQKLPNELNIYDMSGNVREWCADHWHDNYENAPQDGSAWTKGDNDSLRVVRGGSWLSDGYVARVSDRNWNVTSFRDDLIGFRLAR